MTFDKTLAALTGWRGYGLTLAIGASVGALSGYSLRDLMAQADQAAAARAALQASEEARRIEQREAQASAALGLQAAQDQARIRAQTQDLIRSIPAHVTLEADRHCTVPAGFVRLYDDAAHGLSRPTDPAAQPDDAASGIALSAIAAGAAENFGLCHEIRSQLMALQDWERRVGERTVEQGR
jgi:hypothetical protein